MKLQKLKETFKHKYAIRILSGVLIVALVGTGISVSSVSAAKAKGEHKQTHMQVVSTIRTGRAGRRMRLRIY